MFFSASASEVKTGTVSTEQLMNQIKKSPSDFLKHNLQRIEDIQFKDYLQQLMERYNCSMRQLIVLSCLSKPFAYQIMKGERLPGRDVVLRISLSMRATVEETQRMLTLAGKNVLYPKIRRDAAILCCIETHRSLEDTDLFLREHGEKPLITNI